MQMKLRRALGVALLAGAFLVRPAVATVTNAVPWSDAFESYADGASIVGTNGWSAESTNSAVATTAPTITALLTAYTNNAPGRSYPLSSATHASVLQTAAMVTNDVRGATGGVVAVEIMVLPTASLEPPYVPTNRLQYALYFNTSNNLTIWHQNHAGGVTNNEWRALTNGVVSTSAWARLTVIQDYGHNMFQIRTNESTNAVSDSAGWSCPGAAGTQPGSWFYMVRTNTWLSHFMVGGDVTNYVDDVLLTNRCVTWSTNGFVEGAANDGTIDAGTAFTIGVRYDTFAGTNGQALDSTAVMVTNVPTGLTGVVTRLDDTHVSLTLTGQAMPNEQAASCSNLTVVLKDGAFTLGNAANVDGTSNGMIVVAFSNNVQHGSLTCNSTTFGEAAANNGSIGNTLTLSLNGATFTNVATLANGTHYTISNVPSGLTFRITISDATTAVAHLDNSALAHRSLNSTNLNLTFNDSAFVGLTASNVTGSAVSLSVVFSDPPALAYTSGTTFNEAAANDGSIGTSNTITLTGTTFTGVNGDNLAAGGVKIALAGVPTGLTGIVTRTSGTSAIVFFSGKALANAWSNSTSVGLTFADGAFNTVAAGNIDGSVTNLAVSFDDPPVLTYSCTTFAESLANDGSIGNSAVITLTGNTAFAGTNGQNLAAGGAVAFTNVPAGLTGIVTRTSATNATVSLGGKAAAHAYVNSANVTVTFLDIAFTTVAAGNIVGSATNLAVLFSDPPVLTYAPGTTFTEAPTNDGTIGNSNLITLSGATFTGSNGDNFVSAKVSVSNVPAGLTAVITRLNSTQVVAQLTGVASPHRTTNNTSILAFQFLDAAFSDILAANVMGAVRSDLSVTFNDAASLAYSTGVFTELTDNNGAVGGGTITLTGDTFTGVNGQDMIAAGVVAFANVPAGLTGVVTRSSDTVASVSFNGMAAAHAASNSVFNLGVTFSDAAFEGGHAAGVANAVRTDLGIVFADEPGFFNRVPYVEPFEDYTNGLWLAGTNGWTAIYPDAGIITNDATIAGNLRNYVGTHVAFPIVTNHAQVLVVNNSLSTAIHSEAAPFVYVDFMMQPIAMQAVPESNTNVQYAFYVSTNSQLVIWHCNRTSEPFTNEWLTLQNGPSVDTSRWVRFTVAQNYSNQMFQLSVDEQAPIVDPAGWTDAGVRTGSWFYMVQTNGMMHHLIVSGIGPGYLDDVTVRTSLPASFGSTWPGTIFKFR